MIRSLRRTGLPSLCVLVGLASFLFSQSQLQVGYTTLTPDPGSSLPVATALFTYTNSQGIIVSQAGVAAAFPFASGRVFVDESGPQTGIALVNPSSSDASVSFTLRDSKGAKVDSRSQSLKAGNHLATFVNQIFAPLPSSFSTGSLSFDSDQKLAAIALRQNSNAHGEPLYSTLPVIDLSASSSSQPLLFPQIAAGGGYTTQLLLLNPSSQSISGTIALTDSNGNPLSLSSNGSTASSFPYAIDPQGAFRADLTGSNNTTSGYALVTPDSGSLAPSGSALFQVRSNDALVTEAAVASTPLTSSARIFVDNVGCFTGVALANPSSSSVTVSFSLLDRFGSPLDSTSQSLPPYGHLAIFAHQLFPSLSPSFTGLLEISSSSPVAPITLKLAFNSRSDQILTTLPVADLSRLPSAPFAVFPQIAIGSGFSTRLIFINTDKSKSASASLAFFNSNASAMTVPLTGKSASSFSLRILPGAGKQLLPGNAETIASISLLDPSSSLPASEVVVNESQSLRPPFLVLDSSGTPRDDFDLSFSSLSPDVASIDDTGNIHGLKAGFSTLSASSGTLVAAATITVVTVTSGTTGFTISGVAQDLARRLYLSDSSNHSILLLQDLAQTPTTYAGVPKSAGLKDDVRLNSLFRNPSALALEHAQGSLYIADTENHVIRRAQAGTAGKVETLAGSGSAGSSDGTGKAASFNKPLGLALDDKGHLWVADSGNHTIRRITLSTGKVETLAGKAGAAGWQDGSGESARFSSPAGIALEVESPAQQLQREISGAPAPPVSVLVADTGNGAIRRVRETGEVETIRASAQSSSSGGRILREASAGSTGTPLTFSSPTGIAVDQLGGIYVSEPDAGRVRLVLASGEVVPAAQAKSFLSPKALAVSRSGRVVVAGSGAAAQELAYGAPQITTITPDTVGNKGGDRITVKGSNFAPETVVVVSGVLISSTEYQDSQTISFLAPAMPSGRGTITLQHRGGLVQKALTVTSVPLSALTQGTITTVAGGATFAGDGSYAANARLAFPQEVAVDGLGNIFVADTQNHRIRRIAARTGIITTVAGTGQAAFSGDNGPATAASLDEPEAVAVDGAGNLLIADSHNYRIRKVTAETGIISTIAGGGDQPDDLGDNGPATSATVSGVSGIAVDQSDNIYIADTGHSRIRRIDAKTKTITTIAGNGTAGFSGDNGPATQASLNHPVRIGFDSAGNLYIPDADNYRVRRVDAVTGVITTVAGNGTADSSGDGGPAASAQLEPNGVAVDSNGSLFIVDSGDQRIRKVDAATKTISTIAGGGPDPVNNLPATSTELRFVHGIALDGAGNLLITEPSNNRVLILAAQTQLLSRLGGGVQNEYLGDGGLATAAMLNSPLTVASDSSGNLYIADTENNRVRKIEAATGKISTFAGTGAETFDGDGGPAAAASFVEPAGIAFDSSGNVYISASGNSVVLKVDASSGILTIVAGDRNNEGFSGDSGSALAAGLNKAEGIAIDSAGNLFIADTGNDRVRKVDASTKVITTVAGGGSDPGDNGLATAAALDRPQSVAVDSQGNLYIADANHNRVRKVGLNGIITTVAGTGTGGYSGDGGLATAAEISLPRGVVLDGAGNLFIAEDNCVVRRVDAKTQIITTVAGSGSSGMSGDNGAATAATLSFPHGVAIDSGGNLYITDMSNHRIRAVRGPIR